MTQAELAELANTNVSEISKLERGDRRLTVDWLARLGTALGVSPHELMLPPSEMVTSGGVPLDLAPHKTMFRRLPVKGEVAAGSWLDFDPLRSEPTDWLDFIPDTKLSADHVYALKVRGTSLNKIAPDGSVLVCLDAVGAGLAIREGDLVIVAQSREGGLREVTAKRVKRANGQYELWPESIDPKWQAPIFLNGEDETVAVKAIVKYIVISL
ncbi:helix-turn-helix domain-containing protein [Microvirga tunisiensis]|uniref:Helix-turn-helix domain-containing protein n=2 Tax=Pannonibacter tanglangensis TaxID=2750084 RepID=A0A7X5F5J1_9HYPH|nr:helix-turn-helix domain-containing protein [Pannonibacter sp. XCT-53]